MLWDIFCRVIDNHGDVGVCWRLAADLGSRGERVRLWIDDASALAWMAPGGALGVAVHDWTEANRDRADHDVHESDGPVPGDVVVEAFACELPEAFVRRMGALPRPPAWINLEYLSAEAFVERSHLLPSPQPNGLRKVFFYPGFTDRTGGLVRETDLLSRRETFDAVAWLASLDATPQAGECVVSLFCYEQPALADWLDSLRQRPTLLLATTGFAAEQVRAILGPNMRRDALRVVALPALTQRDYDHLLWSSDLNFVRGEDSFVRAQWAGRPFVWQIYPQDDGAHLQKLEAFLALYLEGADTSLSDEVRSTWRAWNAWNAAFRTNATSSIDETDFSCAIAADISPAWHEHAAAWSANLQRQSDLTTRLMGWVAETR